MKKLPFNDIRERAEFGDSVAQVMLGFLLEHGLKMTPDRQRSEQLYRDAAKQGSLAGQYALAMLLGDSNSEESISWFHKAAESGYAPAQFVLGYIHQDGQLTDPNHALALQWLEAAADQGYVPALSYLSILYDEGLFVDKDLEKAKAYRKRAAEKGDPAAIFQLGQGLLCSEAENQTQEGLKLLWQAAKMWYRPAYFLLSSVYSEGLHGVPKNEHLADYFLLKSQPQDSDFY